MLVSLVVQFKDRDAHKKLLLAKDYKSLQEISETQTEGILYQMSLEINDIADISEKAPADIYKDYFNVLRLSSLTNEVSAPTDADGFIKILIDGKELRPLAPVRNVANAFCETFFALAESAPPDFKKFAKQYAFLSFEPPEIKGYFSLNLYKEYHMTDGTVFYIGCHSGSDTQKRQTDNLCRFLKKPEGYVIWRGEEDEPLYRYPKFPPQRGKRGASGASS